MVSAKNAGTGGMSSSLAQKKQAEKVVIPKTGVS